MNTRNTLPSDALYTVGSWLLEQGRERDASDLFRVFAMALPTDERAWLGLCECHARLGQPVIALEMAGTGAVMATAKVRLELMRARLLRVVDRVDEANTAWERARDAALDDEELDTLVRQERRMS